MKSYKALREAAMRAKAWRVVRTAALGYLETGPDYLIRIPDRALRHDDPAGAVLESFQAVVGAHQAVAFEAFRLEDERLPPVRL